MSTTLYKTTTAPISPFRDSVLTGLRRTPKRLDCKYFYDARGSQLFDRICQLEPYYLTRTETEIMQGHASEMAAEIGPQSMLVEYGSGSSTKTRMLLDQLIDPVAYVPVDISRSHLYRTAARLQRDYRELEIEPVAADFTASFELPSTLQTPRRKVAYFPGSTIGNFLPDQAETLLESMAEVCEPGGGLLIGIDLVKDPRTLVLAYDDPAGVTAQFNLNLLHRMQNELNAQLDLAGFEHLARYNAEKARVEIYIRSLRDQEIKLGKETISCAAGELIHTEYSHKYTLESFAELAAPAGWTLRRCWQDARRYFAVLFLTLAS